MKGRPPRRTNSPLTNEFLDARDIGRTPNAAGTPRRETNFVALRVNCFSQTVDPTKAQSFVDRLRPGNAHPPGKLSMKSNPLFDADLVMFLEPLSKIIGFAEKNRRIGRSLHSETRLDVGMRFNASLAWTASRTSGSRSLRIFRHDVEQSITEREPPR